MKIKSLGTTIHFVDKYGIDSIAIVTPGVDMIHIRTRNAEGVIVDGVTKQNTPDLVGHIIRAHNFMIDHVGAAGAAKIMADAKRYGLI